MYKVVEVNTMLMKVFGVEKYPKFAVHRQRNCIIERALSKPLSNAEKIDENVGGNTRKIVLAYRDEKKCR